MKYCFWKSCRSWPYKFGIKCSSSEVSCQQLLPRHLFRKRECYFWHFSPYTSCRNFKPELQLTRSKVRAFSPNFIVQSLDPVDVLHFLTVYWHFKSLQIQIRYLSFQTNKFNWTNEKINYKKLKSPIWISKGMNCCKEITSKRAGVKPIIVQQWRLVHQRGVGKHVDLTIHEG